MRRSSTVRSRKPQDHSKRVVIMGGGIGGLTAAHELIERGFEVAVFEMRESPGGKARSIDVPNSSINGKKPLPGEHGFRFFPGFYKHIPDTMKRIPFGKKKVYDNLVPTDHTLIARANGQGDLQFPAQPPLTPWHILSHLDAVIRNDLDIPEADLQLFARKLLVLLTSCDERRMTYEEISWLRFVEAENRPTNDKYLKYCADGLTRALVACQAEKMSARTGGCILLQLLFDLARPGVQANRVLNGPTSEVWIKPWLSYLQHRGGEKFEFHTGATVQEIHFADGLITGITISKNGVSGLVKGDYYISALPVEVLEPTAAGPSVEPAKSLLTDEMKAFDPNLRHLHRLQTEWMNGIQFYLDKDVKVVRGHTLFIDSPWSLTSICQQQFWKDFDMQEFGDGRVKAVLSVDISNWNAPGSNGKMARECTPEEIKDEVWKQIKDSLNDDDKTELTDGVNVLHWFLDQAIHYPNPSRAQNAEPLLINTASSWQHRPEAVTAIKNFFLAADFVRTNTDLATMESANEAARRAVNGILKASGSRKRKCKVWRLEEPWTFAPLKQFDRRRFLHKPSRPHSPVFVVLALLVAGPLWYFLRIFLVMRYTLVDRLLLPVWRWLARTMWRTEAAT